MGRGALLSVMALYRQDPKLFDYFTIPENLDREALINKLVTDCAELEVIYPDPAMMKESLKFWSTAHLHNWELIYESLNKEDYDPFTDFDRHEEFSETYNDETTNKTGTSQRAFNESALTKIGELGSDGSGSGSRSHTLRQYGNSALGTNQDIIRKEIEIRNQFNVFDIIIADFKKDFCLCVY